MREAALLEPVHIAVLDGITVQVNGVPRKIPPTQRRALLALVVAGQMYGEELAEYLWPERPADPFQPQKVISKLRAILGKGRVPLGDVGYELALGDPDIVDLDIFRKIVHQAEQMADQGDPGAAVILLKEAVNMFTGLPGDLPDTEPMNALRDSLNDERLAAIGSLTEVQLVLGQHARVADSLRDLVRRWPQREQFLHQLMRALYRAQRRPEALDVFDQYRRRLDGAKPSKDLAQLHDQVVDNDPALTYAAPQPSAADLNVLEHGGDPGCPNTFRMSARLTYMASWPGYATKETAHHGAADRAGVELLRVVAGPSVLSIQFEAVDLGGLVVSAAYKAGIRRFVELGALVPTALSTHAAVGEDAQTLYLNPDASIVSYSKQCLTETGVPGVDFIYGNLETLLNKQAQMPDLFRMGAGEPTLVVNQHEVGLERDIDAYARLYADLGEALAPGSWIFVNCPSVDGISPVVVHALNSMYRHPDSEPLCPRTLAQVKNLVPDGWRLLNQREVTHTTDVWERWSGRRSPERNRPGPFPRFALVLEKPAPEE